MSVSLPYILMLGAILIVIVLMIVLIYLIIAYRPDKVKSAAPIAEGVSIAGPNSVSSNEELIAVISAAVTAYMNDTADSTSTASIMPDTKFKVVSFRKVK